MDLHQEFVLSLPGLAVCLVIDIASRKQQETVLSSVDQLCIKRFLIKPAGSQVLLLDFLGTTRL